MKFYNFFCCEWIKSIYETNKPKNLSIKKHELGEWEGREIEKIEEDLEDFYYEASKLLAKCGFEQMYVRNPFDWLILYCAKSSNPMDSLRELLRTRYINMDE
jgi:hypothetical protein